ncbi:hypothetical protein PSH58_14060 [Pseudomonas hefeiensis]|uniref:Lipoprotein n=1 Tax=Pseudomonas hefeiensis TaxID=2738125 RepID=A0ABY9GI70_9PSED|nr:MULTISPECIES: hypothetical protein [unclassified Pseudomonas]WLH15345.1 hypothetical protein PSH57_14035 [Pseudomonas sp. FP205]WLH98395.1 hypothetical protein PSH58_14060 [Pseudomonas sp. FP53]WLI42659.1 hypothetical protein PSH74_13990 [Pseudomonas sp. FP821]
MNRLLLAIMTLLLTSAAQAATPDRGAMVLAQNLPNNNPYNSPIRRANPNSMQGTRPNVPMIRNNPTVPVPRPPTLDNGGIGNGYPRSGQPAGSPSPTIKSPAPARNTQNGTR